MQHDPTEIDKLIYRTEEKARSPQLAFIREAECIGCTKCIQACPVDAIMGSAKQLHTVLKIDCMGCQLCISPCPVDCIEMHDIAEFTYETERAAARWQMKQTREKILPPRLGGATDTKDNHSLLQRRNYIYAAVERAKQKKRF